MKFNKLIKDILEEDIVSGGKADKHTIESIARLHKVSEDIITKQFEKGILVELEHTDDPSLAAEITMDHLVEDPYYYSNLEKIHKEANIAGPGGAFGNQLQGGAGQGGAVPGGSDFYAPGDTRIPMPGGVAASVKQNKKKKKKKKKDDTLMPLQRRMFPRA